MEHTLPQALDECQKLAADHYENFPVASLLLPKKLRLPVSVIYSFARTADDIADELQAPNQQRFDNLLAYENELTEALDNPVDSSLMNAVSYIIRKYELPAQYFYDLLHAFKHDTQTSRYETYQDVLDYCHYSANPVGRLLLHLFNMTDNTYLNWSDNICSALQLINFLQDYRQDYDENNRIYFPAEELQHFQISEQDWIADNTQDKLKPFFKFQIDRTRKLLQSGAPLGNILPGRMGWEIRAIYYGGMTILNKLERADTTCSRPRLSAHDKLMIIGKAIFKIPNTIK